MSYNHDPDVLREAARDIRKAREITKDLKGTDLGLPTDDTVGVDISKTVVNVSKKQIDENTKDWQDMETPETFVTEEKEAEAGENVTLDEAREFLESIGEDPQDDELVVKTWQKLKAKFKKR